VMVSLRLVQSAQQDGGDLQKEDDDEEDAIGGEEDPGLFESATVSKDGDDEDESADGNEDISGLLYHCWCQAGNYPINLQGDSKNMAGGAMCENG